MIRCVNGQEAQFNAITIYFHSMRILYYIPTMIRRLLNMMFPLSTCTRTHNKSLNVSLSVVVWMCVVCTLSFVKRSDTDTHPQILDSRSLFSKPEKTPLFRNSAKAFLDQIVHRYYIIPLYDSCRYKIIIIIAIYRTKRTIWPGRIQNTEFIFES